MQLKIGFEGVVGLKKRKEKKITGCSKSALRVEHFWRKKIIGASATKSWEKYKNIMYGSSEDFF